MAYAIKYPRTSMARLVTLTGNEDTTGLEILKQEDWYAAEEVAQNHRLSSYYRVGKCGFCGGPTPCTRDD